MLHLPYRNPRTWEGNYLRPVQPPVVPPVQISPKSSTAVLTLAVNDRGKELHDVSGPIFERYAQRIGADYHAVVCIHDGTYPMNEKFRLRPYFDHYERLIYLDGDVILTPDCPSLFDIVPEYCIGMYDDMPDTDRISGHHWADRECELMCESQGWPLKYLKFILNSGVIVASKMHKGMFDPPVKPYPNSFCMEQTHINFKILENQYKVCLLDKKYNHEWWSDRFYQNIEGVCVWHFAGLRIHPIRIRGMKLMAEGNYEEAFRVCRMWNFTSHYLFV